MKTSMSKKDLNNDFDVVMDLPEQITLKKQVSSVRAKASSTSQSVDVSPLSTRMRNTSFDAKCSPPKDALSNEGYKSEGLAKLSRGLLEIIEEPMLESNAELRSSVVIANKNPKHPNDDLNRAKPKKGLPSNSLPQFASSANLTKHANDKHAKVTSGHAVVDQQRFSSIKEDAPKLGAKEAKQLNLSAREMQKNFEANPPRANPVSKPQTAHGPTKGVTDPKRPRMTTARVKQFLKLADTQIRYINGEFDKFQKESASDVGVELLAFKLASE